MEEFPLQPINLKLHPMGQPSSPGNQQLPRYDLPTKPKIHPTGQVQDNLLRSMAGIVPFSRWRSVTFHQEKNKKQYRQKLHSTET
jgi:hypothetical protein